MEKLKDSIRSRLAAVREACRSKDAFIKAIETKESSQGRAEQRNFWKNEDLDVTPPEQQTWRWFDYASFWLSYGLIPGTWSVGSSLVAVGLTPWQATICIFVAYALGAMGVVLHSRSAATYHFGFPVESRIPWGMRGAYFPVLLRVMCATIWMGVTLIESGYFMVVILRCIFGNGFYHMKSYIPTSSGVTTQQIIGLFIVWILTLPLLSIPIPKIKIFFVLQTVIVPPSALANVIPWGADCTTLLPRFLNIKRGMHISYILGVCICPWYILTSASTFLEFLGGYSIFLGGFLGIFLTEYYIIRKGNIYVDQLFEAHGRYSYQHGINWRAIVAYLIPLALLLPGFAHVFGHTVPAGFLRLYEIGWLFICMSTGLLYYLLSLLGNAREERTMRFEQIYHESVVLHAVSPDNEVGSDVERSQEAVREKS
ncbi:permease for cytosine/purines, uracil, thiamine, allantoin-domain-containing protein [Exophiala viscosa]|uniref:permease for cytosine/purines, uracil, thiamine, allantoin-domain-containing protein n=1 Tax=Exophiala viscosa TaxID=2486360 RepID=UPI0021979150|nr:permease for cytosine/purines, uracil, thiamine, allantoin-domain-containing protein [Exophiala viscosa]